MAELTAFLSSPAPWAVLTGAGVIALAAMFRPVAFVVTLRRAGGVRALHDALVIEATSAAGTPSASAVPAAEVPAPGFLPAPGQCWDHGVVTKATEGAPPAWWDDTSPGRLLWQSGQFAAVDAQIAAGGTS
jgi:hypothetical protein